MSDKASYVGIGISVVALIVSARACQMSADVAKYQTLSAAFSTYSASYQDFDNALRKPHLALVLGADPATALAEATQDDVRRYYEKAGPILKAYDAYASGVNRVREPWQNETEQQLMDAGTAARKSVMCYLLLQDTVAEKLTLAELKAQGPNWCKGSDDLRSGFEDASSKAIASMKAEVREAL